MLIDSFCDIFFISICQLCLLYVLDFEYCFHFVACIVSNFSFAIFYFYIRADYDDARNLFNAYYNYCIHPIHAEFHVVTMIQWYVIQG